MTDTTKSFSLAISQPTLHDVLKYYRNMGLVGEERLAILQTLLAAKKTHFGVEALSGSGKSQTIDLLLNYKRHKENILLPREAVYILGLASKTAPSYESDAINKAAIIYIEELQKAGGSLEVTEMLKNLAEGKSSSRLVRDQAHRQNMNLEINAGKGVIYTLALENQYKTDVEMKRRFITLTTDVSQKQTKEVVRRKGKERFVKKRLKIMSDEEISALKGHIADCLSLNNIVFENPFAEYLAERMPTPDQKVRSFIDHYFNVVESCALFHYKERVMFTDDVGKQHLIIGLADIILVNLLYSTFFNRDVHSIPPLGIEVLEAFKYIDASKTVNATRNMNISNFLAQDKTRIPKVWASIPDVRDALKDKLNIILSHKVTKETCDSLYDAGYLMRNTANQGMIEYCVADKIIDFTSEINWNECFESGRANIIQFLPEHEASWVASQLNSENKLYYFDPFSGANVSLDAFVERMEAKKEAEAKDILNSSDIHKYINLLKQYGPLEKDKLFTIIPQPVADELLLNNIITMDETQTYYILSGTETARVASE